MIENRFPTIPATSSRFRLIFFNFFCLSKRSHFLQYYYLHAKLYFSKNTFKNIWTWLFFSRDRMDTRVDAFESPMSHISQNFFVCTTPPESFSQLLEVESFRHFEAEMTEYATWMGIILLKFAKTAFSLNTNRFNDSIIMSLVPISSPDFIKQFSYT